MAIVFAVRGTSTTAFFSGGNAIATIMGSASVSASTAAGVIGGSTLDLDQGSFAQHSLVYDGHLNIPLTQTWTVLLRCAVGSTSDANQFFAIGAYGQLGTLQARNGGAGVLAFTSTNYAGSTLVTNNSTFGATISTYYDFVYTFNGAGTTSNQATYRNSTISGTASDTGAARTAYSTGFGTGIILGAQNAAAQNSTRLFVNEFVIWNTTIDQTAIVLADGTTAALNGLARTAFVNVSNINGGLYSDPGITNVRSGTSYTYAGVAQTGSVSTSSGTSGSLATLGQPRML